MHTSGIHRGKKSGPEKIKSLERHMSRTTFDAAVAADN